MKKNGKAVRCEFYHDGFKRKPLSRIKFNDDQPLIKITRTSLIDMIKANKCEICGTESVLSMHHVKKLKDLQGKKIWEKHMIARRQKNHCGVPRLSLEDSYRKVRLIILVESRIRRKV